MNREVLRILYVDNEPVWRGGQDQLFGLMQGMRDRGHRVCLYAVSGSPLGRKATDWGFETVPLRQRHEFSPVGLLATLRVLRRGRFDVLHFNTPRSILMGGLAARTLGVDAIVASRRVNFPLRSRLSAQKYNFLLHKVFTVSESIRNTLVQDGVRSELIEVIYEGVDFDWIDRQRAAPILEDDQQVVIGIVAHLSPEKGHWTLLEAAGLLKDSCPEARFVLVGDGEQREALLRRMKELKIEQTVTFVGFRDDTDALVKQFDVFCLPSLSEGLSSAILSAMASRVPVVATRVGGIPELVIDGETGFLVEPQNPLKLAAALRNLISSPELRQKMGDSGRRRIESIFTHDRKIGKTEAAYFKLLGRESFR